MWVCVKNGFVEVVAHVMRPDDLFVRARRRKDILALFPDKGLLIERTPKAGYLWRVLVSRREFSKAMVDYIAKELDYPNFKAAHGKDSPEWAMFLRGVEQAGIELQKGAKS